MLTLARVNSTLGVSLRPKRPEGIAHFRLQLLSHLYMAERLVLLG